MTLSVIDRSDLIRTIDDDDNIEVDDDSSEDEDVAQPKKNKAARQAKKDFEPEFTFVSSQKEYMKDTWNDIAKYVKKKARTNLDEKIAKIRKERKDTKPDGKEIVVSDSDESSEEELSEDELVEDRVKVKEKDKKRKLKKNQANGQQADSGIDIQVNLNSNISTHSLMIEPDFFRLKNQTLMRKRKIILTLLQCTMSLTVFTP